VKCNRSKKCEQERLLDRNFANDDVKGRGWQNSEKIFFENLLFNF
jgi:hypothetical protein